MANSGVRFGKTVRGGKTHLVVTSATGKTVIACPYAARKPFLVRLGANGKPNPIKAHEVKAADVCHWCRRQDNLTAAWRLNVFGQSGYSMALETLLLNVEVVRTVRQEWERAIEAANAREAMERQFAGDTSRAISGAVLVSADDRAAAERARRLAVVAQYRETEAEQPELVPLSAFGAMKARFAQTHPKTSGRVAFVNLAA